MKNKSPNFIEEEFKKNRILRLAFWYFVDEHKLTMEEVVSAAGTDWEKFWMTIRSCWNRFIDFRRPLR